MEQMRNRFQNMGLLVFFFVLIFNVFTLTKLPIKEVALITMQWTQYGAILGLMLALRKRNRFETGRNTFYIGICLFACTYIISYFVSLETMSNSGTLFQFLWVLIFIAGLSQINWRTSYVVLFGLISVTIILIICMQWIQEGFPLFQFKSYIRNPNIFGVFIAVLLYFPISSFKQAIMWQRIYFAVGIILGVALIYSSTARSAMLLLVIAILARVIHYFSERVFHFLFYAVMFFNLIFITLYSWLFKNHLLVSLNQKLLETTGKQIFSGRQDIWEKALSFALERPFFGHFVGIVPKDYIPDTHYVHVHNQYLQVFLESGIFGLTAFVIFLYGIWRTFQKNLDSSIVVWSASFYLGILFYQSLEISLFVNMQAIGLVQWLIISIGIGAGIEKNRRQSRSERFPHM